MVYELQLLWGHLCKAETWELITPHLMWGCLAHSWALPLPPAPGDPSVVFAHQAV